MNPLRTMMAKALGVMYAKAAGVSYNLNDAALGKFFGTQTMAGKTVTQDSTMQMSAAWGCMRILSETIGALPWKVYKDDGKGNSEVANDHPVARCLVQSPNSNMTSVEFKEAATLNLCQSGNTFSFVERDGQGNVSSLTPIESANVKPKQRDTGAVYYEILDRGQWEDYPQEKVWHVKGFGRTGLIGLSPLGAAREAIGTALAMEDFGARFFSQGGMPSGVVTTDKVLNADQRLLAREQLNQMLGGLGNAHKFALFEGGMKPEPWGLMSLEDMQFILSRKFSIQEICRFYRIPPHMVADLDRATFSNIEHLSQEFVMFTLMPYFTRFESSATKWLFKPGERQQYYLRFNYEGLLRADTAARAEFYSKALQNGYMTRNEVRGKENLPKSNDEGMDDYTVQVNMTMIDKVGVATPVEPNIAPAEKALAPENKVNIMLPNIMKHQIESVSETKTAEQLIIAIQESNAKLVDSFKAMSGSVRAALSNTEREMSALKSVVRHSEEAVAEIKELASADRMVVFDEKGEPIGSRIVKANVH